MFPPSDQTRDTSSPATNTTQDEDELSMMRIALSQFLLANKDADPSNQYFEKIPIDYILERIFVSRAFGQEDDPAFCCF